MPPMDQATVWKPALAELIGTFALVFIGAGTGAAIGSPANGAAGLLGVALAHGLVLMTMIYALGHLSGAHVNPAVTISMMATGRLKGRLGLVYIISQLIGSGIAGLFLSQIFAAGPETGYLGTTDLGKDVGTGKGILIELLLTFLLVTVIFGTAVDDRAPKGMAGLAIGLVFTYDILMGGGLTGAAMNPARHFGPALFSGHWDHAWVYWFGPISGALFAALLYDQAFLKGRP